ncbi:histidine triad nucleotide-binding protein [Beggiatoa leptomitoformis]|uniref:HIT domain-containing protein n=1 Tax=Beggiatoa leptomitoformis TaxID=288004 RepID=A0A2N9YJG6_9GAMM|nr:histidine triad nucleotide-binding protein [Beggiatoa leptomitoformis]ALG67421.1 HIT domain-containing protein [Beggiatoa leptomitoformis]AUI70366.1 HIT domain-containing protein [Beggiatoa leptomitoformis]
MNTEPTCLFCKIVAGQIPADLVHTDEHVVVFKDINPKAPIHLLVVPREHIENLFTIENQHDQLMAHLMKLLPILAKKMGLDGFRTIINTGKSGGQEVFHLHVHLLGGWNTSPQLF